MSDKEDTRKGPEPLGRVITIYEDARIVADVGTQQGLDANSLVVIVDRYDEIVSPETGESLGFIRHDRCELEVEDINERFCVLRMQAGPVDMLRSALPFFKKELPKIEVGDEIALVIDDQ